MWKGARAVGPHRVAQDIDLFHKQAAVPVRQVDREEIRPSWHAVAAIGRHGAMVARLAAPGEP